MKSQENAEDLTRKSEDPPQKTNNVFLIKTKTVS